VLDDAVVWFEQDNERYTEEKTKETLAMQAKQGIKAADFGPEFKQVAVDLYWDDLRKLSPGSVDKLKSLLTK
jgi:hypothetical protein